MLQRVPESFKSIKDVSEDSNSFQKGFWIVPGVFQEIHGSFRCFKELNIKLKLKLIKNEIHGSFRCFKELNMCSRGLQDVSSGFKGFSEDSGVL